MSLPSRLLGANPSIQVSTLLSGSLSTPSAKGAFQFDSFDSISTIDVGSGGSSYVEFTSIPAGYKHLQIRYSARDDRGSFANSVGYVTFNGDTSANYSYAVLYGDGTNKGSGGGTSASAIEIGGFTGSSAQSYAFGGGILEILDYDNTNKYKTIRLFAGNITYPIAGGVQITSGNWRSNSAITTIRITPLGSTIQQYSKFALYGIRG